MKKLLLIGVILILLLPANSRANPIIPEDLLSEIYFADNEWYLLFSEDAFYWNGVNSVFDLFIMANSQWLSIKQDYQPTYVNGLLLITNSDLVQPVSLNPQSGSMLIQYNSSPYYINQQVNWGLPPGNSIGPVLTGQSIIWTPISNPNSYSVDWWPVKNSQPYFNGGWGQVSGTVNGYLKDQYNNPVELAEIRYLSQYWMYPNGYFTPMTTNSNGYFTKNLYAKNYLLSAVIKDSIEYPLDEWLVMEPGTTVTIDLVVDMTVGISEITKMYRVKLRNYPNPFSHQTTIELEIDNETHFNTGIMMISNLSGSVVSVIPFNRAKFEHNVLKYEWMNDSSLDLPNGHYIITVEMDGTQVAQTKMIITK
jgi:hypothetical protein